MGLSYLRMMCVESEMTRQFEEPKVEFMEPMLIKPSCKNWFGTWVYWAPSLPGEYGRWLLGKPRDLRISWGPREEKNSPKSMGTGGKVWW